MDGAAIDVAKHDRNENLNGITTFNVNAETANTKRSRRWVERNEITAKNGEVDRAGRVDDPN
jgi:hypothetical protein